MLAVVDGVGVVEAIGRWNRLWLLGPAVVDGSLQALHGEEFGAGAVLYVDGHKLKIQADWQLLLPRAGESGQVARLALDVTF